MRKKVQEIMYQFGYILELGIAVIVAFAVVVLSVRLLVSTVNTTLFSTAEDALVGILDDAMILAIGVEFIKMLCRHTPETVIEVLLFAIARQLIVVHTSPLENLITILCVAILLAVRKYLLRDGDKMHHKGFWNKNASPAEDAKSIEEKTL